MVRRPPQPSIAALAIHEQSPGPRWRARPPPPAPAPRAVESRSNQTSLLELEEDLATQAVSEREVDESQHCYQKRDRNREDGETEKQDRGDSEEDTPEPLREVVRLGPVLNRPGLDDPGRL